MKKLFDVQHPFFKPMYRRILVVVICLAWGFFELASGQPAWAMFFIATGIYTGWVFFFNFNPPEEEDEE
jgi:hypothetical protein